MQKKHLWRSLQLLMGALLLGYVLKSGILDKDKILKLLTNPSAFAVNFFSFIFITLLVSRRWQIWLHAVGLNISYGKTAEILLGSGFISTFLPSSVGADIGRIGLGSLGTKDSKWKVAQSVFLDRVVGVSMVLMLPGLSILVLGSETLPISKTVRLFLIAVSAGFPLGLFTLCSPLCQDLLPKPFKKLLSPFQNRAKPLALSLALSSASTLLTSFLYYSQARLLGLDVGPAAFFVLVPMGTLASSLPFLPLGIGVGQLAYFHLFAHAFGEGQGALGATVVTTVQAYNLVFCLLSGLCIVKTLRSHKQKSSAPSVNAKCA